MSAIRAWAQDCGIISPFEYERLKQLVWSMDSVYLNHRASKMREETSKGSKKNGKALK